MKISLFFSFFWTCQVNLQMFSLSGIKGDYLTCDWALVTPVMFLSLTVHAPFLYFFIKSCTLKLDVPFQIHLESSLKPHLVCEHSTQKCSHKLDIRWNCDILFRSVHPKTKWSCNLKHTEGWPARTVTQTDTLECEQPGDDVLVTGEHTVGYTVYDMI